MSDLTPITREEALLDGADLEPITRKEQFIKRIYDKTQEIPEPITREEWFLKKAGEGTSPVTIEQLNATENGTYSEPGKAYSPVIVEVPEPTLISKSITANGTYTASADNADGYSSVTVAVDGFRKKSIANTPTDIASFNDGTANPMPSLEISIEPQQDLHGYDNPWVGGAGKNKQMTPIEENVVYRNGGNLFTLAFNNGVITFTITSAGSTFFDIKAFEIKSEHVGKTYTMSYTSSPSLEDNYCIFETWDGTTRVSLNSNTVTITNDLVGRWLCCRYYKYGTGTYTISKCQVEEGQTATPYAPYSNICPISGHTEANVTVTDDLTTPTETHTTSIPFHDSSDNPITVYGGTLNVTSGELRVTHANIASYNGETINEPWISSMDAYSAGTTPTTGAQVVYSLATPQTYQLTPTQVTTLLSQNNIFADCGQILEGEYFVTL